MSKQTVVNRKSTKRESEYRAKYKERVPAAGVVGDKKDISAVRNEQGVNGIALVDQSINRSREKIPVKVDNFISLKELRKTM